MTISCRSVKVHTFPTHASDAQKHSFLKALKREAELERPSFVLDCSRLTSIDDSGMYLLLACLEQAMTCNGDLRLAGVQPSVSNKLRESGISSLFEIFATTESAARSFRKSANSAAMLTFSEDFVETDVRAFA